MELMGIFLPSFDSLGRNKLLITYFMVNFYVVSKYVKLNAELSYHV